MFYSPPRKAIGGYGGVLWSVRPEDKKGKKNMKNKLKALLNYYLVDRQSKYYLIGIFLSDILYGRIVLTKIQLFKVIFYLKYNKVNRLFKLLKKGGFYEI